METIPKRSAEYNSLDSCHVILNSTHMKRTTKWLIILAIFAMAFILYRRGLFAPATIIGSLPLLTALFERFYRIYLIRKSYQQQSNMSQSGQMSVSEALEILELSGKPSAAEIKKAYHVQMKKQHPDQGGSTYMAAKLNEAKTLLMKEAKRGWK